MISKKHLASLAEKLVKRNETIAVAESVTSGLLMAQLSLAKKATEFFQGGVTAYNLGQKTRHLNVDPVRAEKTNSVSELVAYQMALNVSRNFCSDWGIGITGYAVPVPALKVNDCFAFYSIVYREDNAFSGRIDAPKYSQEKVQLIFVREIIHSFDELLGTMF